MLFSIFIFGVRVGCMIAVECLQVASNAYVYTTKSRPDGRGPARTEGVKRKAVGPAVPAGEPTTTGAKEVSTIEIVVAIPGP